jgi:hypothetical protein
VPNRRKQLYILVVSSGTNFTYFSFSPLHLTDSSTFSCIWEYNALLFASFFLRFSHQSIFIFLLFILIIFLDQSLFPFPLLLLTSSFFSFFLPFFFSSLPPITIPKLAVLPFILTFCSCSSYLYFLFLISPYFIFLFLLPAFYVYLKEFSFSIHAN